MSPGIDGSGTNGADRLFVNVMLRVSRSGARWSVPGSSFVGHRDTGIPGSRVLVVDQGSMVERGVRPVIVEGDDVACVVSVSNGF